MTGRAPADPVTLLARGHRLYGDTHRDLPPDPQPRSAPPVRGAGPASRSAADRSVGLDTGLARLAAADTDLARLIRAAQRDTVAGRLDTRRLLDDARADRATAADTALAQRERARRMAGRLRAARRRIAQSRRHSHRLTRRLATVGYPRPHPLAPTGVGYRREQSPTGVGRAIRAALDQLGITDPRARRTWQRGYRTLIARESGGRATAVATQPAGPIGPIQPDGHGLGYARGLTQTLPATFARFHQPGTAADIYDPVANICASINYVRHRYGVRADGADLAALVQQADPHRPPRGY